MTRLVAVAVAISLATVGAACGDEGPSGDPVARGGALFRGEGTCATCHGADLGGTSMGPPLLDPIYAPGHHPDSAIRNAVRIGVQPHHWELGVMPPLPHLDEQDVDDIIAFVREMQREAGIS